MYFLSETSNFYKNVTTSTRDSEQCFVPPNSNKAIRTQKLSTKKY